METRYDYVLVGGGPTSVWAAQNIRERDKEGKVAIFGDEKHPPYDRPPLSKNYLADDNYTADDAYSKFDDFYPKNQIELHTATRVTAIDRAAQTITLEGGKTIGYGKLLLATGSRPNPLGVPGADKMGVFLLRHIEDSEAIRQAMQVSKRVVIVGAGYIGMEVAADAVGRGLDVTVVEPQSHPWARFASAKLGQFLQRYYEAKGVRFVFGDAVSAIEGETATGSHLTVVTKGGQRLDADFVVVGVGVTLNTELAQEAGLEVDPKEGVFVNEHLKTSDPNIWAAGDIAYFQDPLLGKRWHAEHHLNAKWQGQTVGANMAGEEKPYARVAYFFSDELDIHMILRGDPQGGKNTVITGDVDGAEFTELYYDDAGVLTMGISISHEEKKLDPLSDTLERLIEAKVNIKGREAEIQAAGFDLNTL
ncbi:MAG TPA: NAD(P)/FAD-dependent oxidoreductase [Chthonomonadaceae bacterium]|nr:NAD(P)/FAD-dependent oxidoreductase [Chthonomonadaceae bacterium]